MSDKGIGLTLGKEKTEKEAEQDYAFLSFLLIFCKRH